MVGILLMIVLGFVLRTMFYTKNQPAEFPAVEVSPAVTTPVVAGELLAFTSTEQEAHDIAKLYEIDLKYWDGGLAVFTTDRDIYDVIRQGKEKGWPALSVNGINQLH